MPFICMALVSVLVLSSQSLFAKDSASRLVSEETTGGETAYPPQVLECQSASDCGVVRGACGEWVVVNKINEKPLEKFFSQVALETECAKGKVTAKPKVECRKGLCERSQGPAASEMSVNLWKDQCPAREIEGSVDGLEERLQVQVQRLHSSLGWERWDAVEALAKMGTDAKKAIPWVLAELKKRGSLTVSQDAQCLLGEPPTEELLIGALGQMDPSNHPALPVFIDWLKDEKKLYRHADILKHLLKLGPKATPALPILEDILDKASDRKWTEERGLLALDVVTGLGKEAKPILPSLQKWTEKSSTMKTRLFMVMVKVDNEHERTKKTAVHCLKQTEDSTCRTLALHFLNFFPEELVEHMDLLQKMLASPDLISYRMAALRAIQGLGLKAKPLVAEVAKLGLQSQEDVRRQAALVLKSIDPEGNQSLSILKQKVYQGFAFEPQYVWKVIDSPLTRLELLKSYFYFVTGKRYKFTELKIAPEMERLLINCINSPECPNRTSAMAAVVLLKSEDPRLRGFLASAMRGDEAAIRWDASGAYILLFGQGSVDPKKDKDLARAWALQDEALHLGGTVRLIDLEDILLATNSDIDKKFRFVHQRFKNSDSIEILDVMLLLANQEASGARNILSETLKHGDKQKVFAILNRMGLVRKPLSPWFSQLNEKGLQYSEAIIQETAVFNQMSLRFNR